MSMGPATRSAMAVHDSPQSIDVQAAWQQLVARDPAAGFVYGVTTTGIFCRPSCGSRLPLRRNVQFFPNSIAARAAGFRPCKKCRPTLAVEQGGALDKVRAHIEGNYHRPIRLDELGRLAGLSPFTVQRQFKREMGVSPLAYQRALRAGALRAALKKEIRVTDAIYDCGFGSSSRGYEGAQLGMTPAKFAQGGKGEQIGWWSAPSPFGWIVLGGTKRGLCWLSLAGSEEEGEADLRAEFPAAAMQRDPALAASVEAALRMVRDGDDLGRGEGALGDLDLRGTVFQLRVWNALRRIPRGETWSYSELAREIGDPNATRAVARACAMNRVAVLVPCHRVIGMDGSLTGYRWGMERKRALLEAEKGGPAEAEGSVLEVDPAPMEM